MYSSSLLTTATLLATTQALAQYGYASSATVETAISAAGYGSSASAATALTATYGALSATNIVTSPASAATATAATAASGDWQMSVTWPAGCESWANPCPSGAHISGGGVAGAASTSAAYTNGFTSYLTETDSAGVVTGMPTKATVAAGVSTSAASTLATVASASSSSNATVSLSKPSASQSGFDAGATATSNSASSGAVAGTSLAMVVAGLVAFFC